MKRNLFIIEIICFMMICFLSSESSAIMKGMSTEDLFIDRNKSVTLEGGYNCDYTSSTGKTIINITPA